MKTWKIATFVALIIVAVALATSSVYAYMGRSQVTGAYNPTGTSAGGYGSNGYGGGMMGGHGMMGGSGYNYAPTTPTEPITPIYPVQTYGGMGCGMMNRGAYAPTGTYPTTTTINITTAGTIAQTYVASLGNSNLAVTQVEEYAQNF